MPVPEETLTHSHPSWLSDILYQLPTFTTIHSILCVQFTCLTVLSDNLSPGPLWSSSWSCTLYFILHAFLHTVIVFFSQHKPITMQPGHISNNNTKASQSNNTFTRHARTYTHIYALAHMHPVHMYASTYRVGQKTEPQTHDHNSARCSGIFVCI